MTKMMKRHLCLLLAAVMVCALLPLSGSAQAAPAPQAEETEAIPQRGVYEVDVLREENVKHFALPDGTYQAVVYGEPIHELDENGQWQEIDNSLYLGNARGTELYADAKGNTAFAKSFAFNKPVFSISNGGYGISMSVALNTLSTQTMAAADAVPEAQVTNAASRRSTTYSTVEEAAEVDRSSTVRYANVLPGVDLKYTVRNRNVEENIVVKTKADSYSYRFALDLDGLYARQEADGSISLLDSSTNERKYVVPTGLMYDANETVSYDVAYALTEESGKYYLTVTADEEWINDPARAMPVSIEQLTINESTIHDTCVRIKYREATHGTSQVMWIASHMSGVETTHALIRGEFPTLPGNATILDAYMRAYYYYNDNVTTGNFNIGVYPLNGSWNEYDATWNNTYYLEGSNSWIYVAFTNAANNATINNPKPINVPLTSLAQEWARDPDSNNGVKLKYENGSNYSVCLRSSESGSTYSPRFYITYEVKGLSSGVYTLTSAATSKIAYYPDHKAGSNIRQTTSPAELSEKHQFKFCYLGNVDGEDYYTIRPMTNNGIGLAVMDSAGTVKAKEISTSNSWDDISETERWSVKFIDGYYQIRNGASETGGYLSVFSASNSAPDHLVVNATATSTSSWTLREQQGNKSEAVFVNSVSEMHLDSQSESEVVLDFLAVARSYDSAENGPVQYFVTNENGETTDRAEFIDGNGKLRIYKPGIIKVGATITDENEAIWVTVYIYKTVRSIEFLHDEGYAIRYSGTNGEGNAQARIGILLDDLFVWYMNNLGVKVVWPALSEYTSYADECGEGYDVEVEPGDFPDMPCSCGDDCQNGEYMNNELVKSVFHHKNLYNVVLDLKDWNTQQDATVLFSGHLCCRNIGEEYCEVGLQYGLTNAEMKIGCIADRYGTLSHERFTTIHEVGHLFGAIDHYDTVNNGGADSRYSTEEMNNGDPNGPYKDECIYGLNWRNYTSGKLDTIRICDGCRNDMLSYLGMAETE